MDIALKVLDLVIVIVAAILAYRFGIRKLVKERELNREESKLSRLEQARFRKIDLYRKLIQNLPKLTDASADPEELKNRLNGIGRELLLFAPDHVYKEYTDVLKKVRRGVQATSVIDFFISLRKELIPDTELKAEDVVEIEKFENR